MPVNAPKLYLTELRELSTSAEAVYMRSNDSLVVGLIDGYDCRWERSRADAALFWLLIFRHGLSLEDAMTAHYRRCRNQGRTQRRWQTGNEALIWALRIGH